VKDQEDEKIGQCPIKGCRAIIIIIIPPNKARREI
jgi:hypothetical protein